MIWPNTTAIAFTTLPQSYRGLGIGILTGLVGVALAIGPVLGGFFATYLSWRWLFLINVPICILVAIAALVVIPNSTIKSVGKNLNVFSSILLAVMLTLLSFGLNQLPSVGMHLISLLAIIISIVLVFILLARERRLEFPILPTALMKNRVFLYGCLLRIFTAMPFYIILFVIGFFLQQDLHLSAFSSGMVFLPMMLTIAALSPVAGRWAFCLATLSTDG